jgi:hypothetical protein
MSTKIFKNRENFFEKNLTRILLFFNLIAGKVPHVNAPIPSLYGRQLTQLNNKGRYFE